MASGQGTINDVIPTDLMREIFFHCLPWDPLKYEQPDVSIAPMLLCHVCSQWRTVAFQTPLLWTQLYHLATLRGPVGTFDSRDVHFLRWWREKVQDVSPSLRLAFKEYDDYGDDDDNNDDDEESISNNPDSGDFVSLIVQFMSNAHYLNLDFHYNHLLRTLHGERQLICPNLHTLVMRQGVGHKAALFIPTPGTAEPSENLDTEKYIPVNSKQDIRRLVIEDLLLNTQDVGTVLNFSNITHLGLSIHITIQGWFSLLRESVNLIYGSFSITFHGEVNDYTPQPKVIPHLRQMTFENFGMDLQQSFLNGLHLPSLTGLRVDNHMPLSVDRLHQVLSSTPSLRILQLGPAWTTDEALLRSVFFPGDLSPTITPLSSVVPQLESIHFEGTTAMVDISIPENRDLVISVLNGDWLQLGRPGSLISKVYLGDFWEDGNIEWREIVDLVDDLQQFMPAGVELVSRPYTAPKLWLSHWKHGDFTDEFEDLRFEMSDSNYIGESST